MKQISRNHSSCSSSCIIFYESFFGHYLYDFSHNDRPFKNAIYILIWILGSIYKSYLDIQYHIIIVSCDAFTSFKTASAVTPMNFTNQYLLNVLYIYLFQTSNTLPIWDSPYILISTSYSTTHHFKLPISVSKTSIDRSSPISLAIFSASS